MSTIEFACTNCGKKMKTGEANAGKKGKCPKCGTVLDIPALGAGEAPLMPPSQPPARPAPKPKGGEDELFGASSGSTVSWDANQDFLSELAGPAAGAGPADNLFGGAAAPAPMSGPQDMFGGLDPTPGAYAPQPGFAPQPGYAPQPGFAPQPGYAPAAAYGQPAYPANPYAAPAAVPGGYGRAPAQADTPGIISLICGIGSLVLTLLGGCVSGALFFFIPPLIYLVLTVSVIVSGVGLFLCSKARPGGMKTAGTVLNIVNLVLGGASLLVMLVLLVLGLGILGLAAASR